MFARITVLEFLPDEAEQGFDIVKQSIVPSIREQHGFKGLLLLRDQKTGSASAVTLWESVADMDATAAGNYPVQLAKISGLLAGAPTRQIYEVTEVCL
jgi:heme-degrading monooxygenase HmoA